MTKTILIIAGLLSALIAFAEYMVYGPNTYLQWYSLSLLGMPGLMVAQLVLAALFGGHGGGPLYQQFIISVPVNFAFYTGLGWGVSRAWRLLKGG